MKRFTSGRLLAAIFIFLALPIIAQNRTAFGGRRIAIDYDFGGVGPNVPQSLSITGGPYASGVQTITIAFGYVTAGDGTSFCPLATNALINVGAGSSIETVTPSAVSCSGAYNSTTITANFSNVHGQGEIVTSATYGLQEAIDIQASAGGGLVDLSPGWTSAGGTNATIALAVPVSSVTLEDLRGPYFKYYTTQPTTLTSLAVPATLTSSTVVFAAAPVGTWANSAYYFCVTYVDILGGESPCSLTYTQTPTLDYSATITSPPASAGAVGWRFYAGITSVALAYLAPITSANCTLTTLETVVPACAIGSNGVFLAPPLTTGLLSPSAIVQVTNVNNPVMQGHTTFAYQPSAVPSPGFQTEFGPFGTALTATASDKTQLGAVNLPAGYLNSIGRTLRIKGKIKGGVTTTGYLNIVAGLMWAGGGTAGAPVTACTIVDSAATFTTGTVAIPFECTLDTNAVGATAVGSATASGWAIAGAAAVLGVAWTDNSTAAVGSLGLFAQDTLMIYVIPTTEDVTTAQLIQLTLETLQ